MVRTRGTNGAPLKDREDIADAAHDEAGGTDAASLAGVGEPHGAIGDNAAVYLGLGEDPHAGFGMYGHPRRPAAMGLHANASVPPRFPPFRESYGDMVELRRELKVISVQLNVPYYMHHSSPQRLEARCPTWKHRKEVPTTCEFVIAANRHTNGRVYVTRAVVAHSPNCAAIQTSTNNVSATALMETAKPFMQKIAETVKPRDMANMMKEKFGVSASYMTAWRALSAFKQEKKAEESMSFTKIQGYLESFAKSNEGSVIAFERDPSTNIFTRAFLCPQPMQGSLRYCRPQLLLSVFLITSTYGGIVMTATAQDAMGENVPIAIGIALKESEENWRFFLEHLRVAIPDLERSISTITHNRGDELQRAASLIFPSCGQSGAVELFISPMPAAPGVVSSSQPGQNTLHWVEGLCSKTPLMILVGWVSKVASTLYQRYEKHGKMSSEYPEEFHTLLSQYETESDHYEVLRISEHGYEVIDQHSGRQRIVDFAKQTCTCGEYDVSRFPCLHVFLAVSYAGLVRSDVIPQIFLMTSLKSLYHGRVTPIDVDTVVSDNITVPHPVAKTRGRPRKVQQIQQFSDTKHEKLACSICGMRGHNKRTCKRALVSAGGAGIVNNVDGDASAFLDAAYETSDLHPDIMSVPNGEQQMGVSPSVKRRKLTAKASSDVPDSTVV
ncbi:hypothetical protein Poli38472_003167 [Pythium oligandrum]|uniref:SWIM-type domain-containing protein n=1 Tax=Pythium oligandrum TaxID=41045 RepID=A0A8K1FF28_PYTOL|nr:hypothetical protein Poli38472_003167 [Pythium oligandrum]|eukprot:TMW57242.1 hypothetical protein Poli38472_003167 [Pythium oligandrum]